MADCRSSFGFSIHTFLMALPMYKVFFLLLVIELKGILIFSNLNQKCEQRILINETKC